MNKNKKQSSERIKTVFGATQALISGFLVRFTSCFSSDKKCFFKFLNQRGSALLMTVLVLSSVLVIALASSNLVVSGVFIGRVQGRSVVSFFAAEAGSERSLWEIRKNSSLLEECDTVSVSPPDYKFVDFSSNPATCSTSTIPTVAPLLVDLSGSIKYYIKISTTSPEMKLQSVGTYNGVNRTMELSYYTGGGSCTPDCTGKVCGDDGCNNGGSCGTCSGSDLCVIGVCTPALPSGFTFPFSFPWIFPVSF